MAGKSPNVTETEMEREIYIRLLLSEGRDLGIHVGDDAVAPAANEMLRALGRNGQPVPMDKFVNKYLQPEGLTAVDFKNFVRP